MANISHGANSTLDEESDTLRSLLPGKTLLEVRDLFSNVYNIPPDATVSVNGLPIPAEDQGAYVVNRNDDIIFAKPTGSKGI